MFDVDSLPFVGSSDVYNDGERLRPVGGKVKRAFDVGFSLVALLSVALLFVAIMVMIRLSSRGSVFYVHHRVGYGGRLFPCLKFRTMVIDADDRLRRLLESDPVAYQEFELFQKLKRDPRIIPGIGSFLRTTSLDELPQLINVLLGQMSIVGPRPVTKDELGKYSEAVGDYLRSRPGITGLWQVSGRNDLSFEDRVKIDQSYVYRWSFLQDLRIILRTFHVVVLRRGAY
jgi:lipopolysaccharide/colanic/teichoic acid biosynthesis glycosyltransferase